MWSLNIYLRAIRISTCFVDVTDPQWNIGLYGRPSAVQYALVNCEPLVSCEDHGPRSVLNHGPTALLHPWEVFLLKNRDSNKRRSLGTVLLIFSNATSMLWSSECTRTLQKVLYRWTDKAACVPFKSFKANSQTVRYAVRDSITLLVGCIEVSCE